VPYDARAGGADGPSGPRSGKIGDDKDGKPAVNGDDHEQNPIVAMAMKIRARRELGAAIDSATQNVPASDTGDAQASFAALADALSIGSKRLNSILGKAGVTFVRLEQPLRVRLRFAGRRIALDLDRERQLVLVNGLDLDGEYQFDTSAEGPALINLSKLSTQAGYGEALTAATLLKAIAEGAELPRPPHLDAPGPMRF
jgi:hypothetical protein